MNKKEFLKRFGLTEDQFIGKEKVGGYLYLSSVTSIPEGFNPTVGGSLDLRSVTSIPEGFNPTVGGYLDLRSVTSIPEGFNPTVGGSLDLRSVTSIPEGFNPTVGGSLYLSSVTSIHEGFNPTVGGSLDLRSVTSIPEGFNPTVGGSLDLRSVTSIHEGFNPTVGGSLDLRSVTSIPEGFNPTVGGSLYLSSATSIHEGFNPTVGGSLYLSSGSKYIGAAVDPVKVNNALYWRHNEKTYASIDGIFCEVLSERTQTIQGEDCRIISAKKVGLDEKFIIANKGGHYAHASDVKKAFEELEFKITAEKLKNEPISPDTLITVKHYRAITGACDLGCRGFLDANKIPYDVVGDDTVEKKPIKASELLTLLEKSNAYGLDRFKKLIQA